MAKNAVIWLIVSCACAFGQTGVTFNGLPNQIISAPGVPQMRTVGPNAVTAGVPVTSGPCIAPSSSVEQCIGPSNSLVAFTGIPLTTAFPGSQVTVQTNGKTMVVFDNQPVQGDIAVVGVGTGHDSGATNSLMILCTQGVIGRILTVIDSTHGMVNVIGLGKRGDLMTSDCMDPVSMPAYIKANQNTGAQGPSGTTYVGTCTITQTAAIALVAGFRTLTTPCTGVVSGGYYYVSQTAASVTSNTLYYVFAAGQGTAANTLQVQENAPALALAATYTLTLAVWKMN